MAEPHVAEILRDTEGGFLARLSGEMDLDAVMLEVLVAFDDENDAWRFDEPTYLPATNFNGYDGGYFMPLIGWFRKQPCVCGEDHPWDWAYIGPEKPEGNKRFGAWLGVYFG